MKLEKCLTEGEIEGGGKGGQVGGREQEGGGKISQFPVQLNF